MARLRGPENPSVIKLIRDLEKSKQDFHKKLARQLKKSKRSKKGVNVWKIQKYAKDKEDGAYVVSVFLKKPLIITLRVGHDDMELVLSDKKGKIREFVSQKEGVLERM